MNISRILIILVLGTASSLSATLTATTTTLASSLNPSTYGQPVTFTAVVTSALGAPPNGETVTFKQASKVLGTGALRGGSASFTTSTLTTGGTDPIKAVYAGDATFASSTSSAVSQVVDKATTTTTLASSENPSNVGQSVTFTASVAPEFGGAVTGTVAFNNGSTKLTTVLLSGGVASYTTARLAGGTASITAVYNGSTSFTTSTSTPLSQTVGIGTIVDSTMTWDGVTRYYQVFLPTVLPVNPPLVFMLHGTITTPSFTPESVIATNWGWTSIANQYGFILVQPASTYDATTHQWNWNAYFMDAAFPQPAPDDSGFMRQLIVNLTAQYNVNPNQVYVTGFSSGAQMTERIGVEISDLVAAISPVSGQMEGQQMPAPPVLAPGNAVAPVSVQEWQGTLDENLWPCGYGTTKYSGVTFTLDTVDDTFNYWTAQNSCTTLQTTQPLCLNNVPNNSNDAPTPGMTGMTGNIATGCSAPQGQNIEVQFIWEPNVAHSAQQQNNPTRWLFFAAHPKP
jgi:poly(hydroxyalkanoate) depolymerase family esterase